MLTRITTDAQDQTWMQLRVCPQCTPHEGDCPSRPFGLDVACPSCRGPGEVIWRATPQYHVAAAHAAATAAPPRGPQRSTGRT